MSPRVESGPGYWDEYWSGVSLPVVATRAGGSTHSNAILDVLERHLPHDRRLTAAELGGAPGQYLAFMHTAFGYSVTCIDNSPVGCELARQNFEILGIPGHVIEDDVLAPKTALPRFDVVYSLGLIEHFDDPTEIIRRHVELTTPGGFVVLGIPNLRGVHGWLFKNLRPQSFATHVIPTMDLASWTRFEKILDLQPVFKGYVGGFEPLLASQAEHPGAYATALLVLARALGWLVRRPLSPLRRINGPLVSGYAMGVYRVP